MSDSAENSPLPSPSPHRRKPRSTWVVIGLAVLFLIGALTRGLSGLGSWLVLTGLLLLLTAGYAILSRRQSWARLETARLRKTAMAVGAGSLILGGVFGFVGAPPPQPVVVDDGAPTSTSTPSTSTSSPTEESIVNQACTPEASSRTQEGTEFLCTRDNAGELIWMEKNTSEQLTEARKAAAEQATAEAEAKAAAERQAAEAEAARLAEQQNEADRQAAADAQQRADEAAEAQRLAEEATAEAEAQRLAAEAAAADAARRLAEEQKVAPNPATAPYENCDAVRAAGADPIYPGQPGWHPRLDGNDNDGIGCEP